MDSIDLDLNRRQAGADYLRALKSLGLHPDALFWAFDKLENRFVLILANQMVDFKGPLAVADLLFKAYNAALTPIDIDPFLVRLHSPDQTLMHRFDGFKDPAKLKLTPPPGSPLIDPSVTIQGVTFGDVEFRPDWVYEFQLPPQRRPSDLRRHWNRFSERVGREAA